MKTHTTSHSHTRTGNRHNGAGANTVHLMDDARALLSATANVAGAKVSEARERLKTAVTTGKQSVIVRAQATDKVIRANPYHSIAIGAGLALLAGFFLGRRTRAGNCAKSE
jgi:ElaB/YqjD/DUF883 family membrane-anchored ribosome-binding protein